MAATLTTLVRAFLAIGDESARAEVDRTVAGLSLKHDIVANIPENSGQIVTLWDATVNLAAWSYGIIIVDPSDEVPTLVLPLLVTLKIAATPVFVSFQVKREVPLLLNNTGVGTGASELLAAVTNFNAAGLTLIQARNTAGVGNPAGSNNVKARCLFFG